MAISKRLKTIAEMVTPGSRVADIGTDHGYVPIYLLRNEISPGAIAVDLSKGSLEKAEQNIRRAGLEDKIECRLSDGLEKIEPGEVDTIIISGMGGILMQRILSDGIEVVKSAKELILSPHRDTDLVRSFTEEIGFQTEEIKISDKNKTYTILHSQPSPWVKTPKRRRWRRKRGVFMTVAKESTVREDDLLPLEGPEGGPGGVG